MLFQSEVPMFLNPSKLNVIAEAVFISFKSCMDFIHPSKTVLTAGFKNFMYGLLQFLNIYLIDIKQHVPKLFYLYRLITEILV